MKKILVGILSLLLALSFAGCANTASTTATTAAAREKEIFYYGFLTQGGVTEEELTQQDAENLSSVGVENWDDGTTQEQWVAKYYDDLNTALWGLDCGDVVSVDCLKSVLLYVDAQNPGKYSPGTFYVSQRALAMAVKSENTALLEKLNGAIAALKEDGTLDQLAKDYLTDFTKMPEPVQMPVFEGAETVRVVVTGDLPPYDYVTPDGKAAGYNVALLSAISEKVQLNIELVYANAGSRYIQLTSGKADVIFWVMGSSYSESAEFNFNDDLPEGMAVTDSYATDDLWSLYLKDADYSAKPID